MRRRFGIVVPALLALALLVTPVAALADEPVGATDGAALVLAVEEGEPLGPEPRPRADEDNPARDMFPDMETQFTWGAAWLLAVAGVVGVGGMIAFYLLRVRGPEQRESAGRR
jgi:hypothetical protein